MPDRISLRIWKVEYGVEPSRNNVSVLDRIVEHLLRCSTAWCNVRVEAFNIKSSIVSDVNSFPEINESVEVNASISVILSSNDTLRWKRDNMVVDQPWIQVSALGVREEDIA